MTTDAPAAYNASITAERGAIASITIRNIDEETMRRLRVRAAEHGRSAAQEAREILIAALDPPENLAEAIHSLVAPIGGWEMELPPREPMREPPSFD